MTQLELSFLGTPVICLDGAPVRMPTRKTTAFLAYLAITNDIHSRELLTTLFWPESDTKRARASLRRVLANVKKIIGDGWLNIEQDQVSLNSDADISVDVWEFCQLITMDEQDAYAQAIEIYRADLLAGFGLRQVPMFDEWLFFEREALQQRLAQGLNVLVKWYVDDGLFEQAIPYGRKLLALDSFHEPAHFQLMQLYAESGQRTAALRQYEECQRLFMEELAVEPSAETKNLFQQIKTRRFQKSISPESKPALESHNLPNLPTSFVGREVEIAQIKEILSNPSLRLLTLFGLGGVGKTRLALHVAHAHVDLYGDGVWLIDLVSVQSSDALVTTIAQTLAIELRGIDSPQEQLQAALREKEMLWVIDNFEHLIDGAFLLSDLLRHVPNLKILVTSREILDLAEEWLYEVEGLAYPTQLHSNIPNGPALLENGRFSAIQLFAQRARQVQHDFSLTTQRIDVIKICQLVEGMPLAIELAAAWVRMLNCGQIANEIKQNLDFLTTTQQNVDDRHRSIRAVFEYSWQLLSSTEKTALAQLSVFRGVFSSEAALAVAEVPLFTLYSLLNKSLLRAKRDGWYELHELLRQFAAEKLPNPDFIHEQHMVYYTTFLHEREQLLFGRDQTETLHVINQEIQNVYQAWSWAAENGRFVELNRAFHSLYNYHAMRGLYFQGEQLLRQTLPLLEPYLTTSEQEATTLMVRLMARQGEYLYMLSKLSQAEDRLRQTLSLAQQMEMVDQIMLTSQTLGVILYLQGFYAEAKHFLTQALDMATTYNNRHRQAYSRMTLGAIEQALGNYNLAQDQHQTSLTLYQALDYQWGVVHSLRFLGVTAFRLGHYDEAKNYLQQGLSLCQTLNNEASMAMILNNLGMVEQALDNPMEAHQQYQQSLALGQASHVHLAQATSLQNLGRVMMVLDRSQQGNDYLHQALDLAVKTEATPLILDILLDVVPQIEKGGQKQQAGALVAFIEQHSASNWETQSRAKNMQIQLGLPTDLEYLKIHTLQQLVADVKSSS